MLWSEDREKKTQNWISLLSPIRAMQSKAFSKSLYERDLLSFYSVHGCSGLGLNLITRKDRVCLSSSLKQWAMDIPSVSRLNCQNLALVTSNKTLHIVYSNRWARKSGFIWFLFRRRSRFDLPFFFFLLWPLHFPCVWIPAHLVGEFFHKDRLSDIKNHRAFVAPS